VFSAFGILMHVHVVVVPLCREAGSLSQSESALLHFAYLEMSNRYERWHVAALVNSLAIDFSPSDFKEGHQSFA
jgi:hypothetical protein